ncbi:hypothetical protein HK100_001406 [Physocladia obscura]|uniref:Uncharacterized protein n=1 Tax=Physocladia obscura TaxID=109957 RepID=A0AAD5SXW7_9FUNG|nr:hypothetical protein HK100_001406 [Physocladia obscura]
MFAANKNVAVTLSDVTRMTTKDFMMLGDLPDEDYEDEDFDDMAAKDETSSSDSDRDGNDVFDIEKNSDDEISVEEMAFLKSELLSLRRAEPKENFIDRMVDEEEYEASDSDSDSDSEWEDSESDSESAIAKKLEATGIYREVTIGDIGDEKDEDDSDYIDDIE